MPLRIEEKKLANGITLIAKQIPGVKWQLCRFVIHAGAASDPKRLPGLAHFVEHMVSANHSMETADMKNFFREAGGHVMLGSTGFFSTSYGFKLPSDSVTLTKGLGIFKELISEIKFTKHIERERTIIKSEYSTRFPVPKLKELRDKIISIIRKGTVVESRNRPLGEEHAIESISYQDLQEFYDQMYHAGNLSILTIGSCNVDEIATYIEKAGFTNMEARGERPVYSPVHEFAPRTETYIQYRLSDYVTFSNQKPVSKYESHVVFPIGTNDNALGIAAQMLSKVLFEEIREKQGLVYDARASKSHFKLFMPFSIVADNFDVERVDDLKRTIEECIISTGANEGLFEFMKKATINRLAMLDVTGATQLDVAEDELIYEGRITEVEEDIELIRQVTFKEVQDIFALMRPENRLTVVELP